MSFLGSAPTLISVNFLLQIVVYVLIIIAFAFRRKNNFKMHGIFAGLAVVLSITSTAIVMAPSLIRSFEPIVTFNYGLGSAIILVHEPLGALATIMGILAIVRLRPCGTIMGNKRFGNVRVFMKVIFLIWTLSFVVGVALFTYFYVL